MSGKYLSVRLHFVWSTAGRALWIEEEWQAQLYQVIGGALRRRNGRLICAGGIEDHVHLYASIPSTETIADLVSVMKSNSSRWIHQNFARLKSFAWQKGYGAFSVSKSGEISVINYINNQREHHRGRTFKEEFLSLLEKHGVEYDERYIWD